MKHTEMVALMGRMVMVSKVLERRKGRRTEGAKVVSGWWEEKPLEKPRTGWVVGFRHLQVGYVEPESGRQNFFGEDEYSPAEWRTEKVIPCVLVAFWPTEKPVHAPMDGYEGTFEIPSVGALVPPGIYLLGGGGKVDPPHQTTWVDRETADGARSRLYSEAQFRENMRDEMKDWPRDEKGRWRKKS